MFANSLTQTQLTDLFTTPEVRRRLGLHLSPDTHVAALSARGSIYQVTSTGQSYIVRLPRDETHLASLHREARLAALLRGRISIRLPDTQVIDDLPGHPAFAIHSTIAGEPLTTEHYSQPSPEARKRLVTDLAHFFRQMHAVSLDKASAWLGLEHKTGDLAPHLGKPLWFDAQAIAEMRPGLIPVLDENTWPTFEHTVALFEALDTRHEYMVFGHGDLHGYNAAVVQDDLGPRLAGAFDLENIGILDLHEDFFRLSLVSEEMLDDVLLTYQRLPGTARSLDRARIAIYYRAFLFYLMVGQTGERLGNLHRLLSKHLIYYRAHHGGLDKT